MILVEDRTGEIRLIAKTSYRNRCQFGFEVRLRAGLDVSGQNSEFLRSRSVEGPDPRPRGALDFKILASTISAITFGKQSRLRVNRGGPDNRRGLVQLQ